MYNTILKFSLINQLQNLKNRMAFSIAPIFTGNRRESGRDVILTEKFC